MLLGLPSHSTSTKPLGGECGKAFDFHLRGSNSNRDRPMELSQRCILVTSRIKTITVHTSHHTLRVAAQLGISSFLWLLGESPFTDFPSYTTATEVTHPQLKMVLEGKTHRFGLIKQNKTNSLWHKEAQEVD